MRRLAPSLRRLVKALLVVAIGLLCLDGLTSTSESVSLQAGHTYRWTVQARQAGQPWIISDEAEARFSVDGP